MIKRIKAEIRFAPINKKSFHVIELKTGKEKVVGFGGIFPLKSTKAFMHELQNDFGIEVVNMHEFFKEVRGMIKRGEMK
ncbi:hypothetical protein [Bacillus mycoides]|uniref:hypothetical protein n=1 Tax=Bacillus mycoides TaxID=1405 RepID=UPI0002DCF703|nr:hypothetical protein [Bacillus mycoides]